MQCRSRKAPYRREHTTTRHRGSGADGALGDGALWLVAHMPPPQFYAALCDAEMPVVSGSTVQRRKRRSIGRDCFSANHYSLIVLSALMQ